MTISDKKRRLIEQLNRFIELHEQGKCTEISSDMGLDEFDKTYPDFDSDINYNFHPLMIAWDFCNAWVHECNHSFRGCIDEIEFNTWPVLARHIVEKLTKDEEITEPLILKHFLDERKPSLMSRIKDKFRND